MKEARLDPNGGIRLFNRIMSLHNIADWHFYASQFTSDHSIEPLRIAHIESLIAQRQ
jgi:hypothetical protein